MISPRLLSAFGLFLSLCTFSCGLDLPATGFISAESGLGTVTIRILEKLTNFTLCDTITIRNQPSPNASPLVGKNVFRLNGEAVVNGHFSWTNGKEHIFFVPTSGNEGNWLIGFQAGVDSGFVFLESADSTLSPLEILPEKNWKWLLNNQWVSQPSMRMECISNKDNTDSLHFAGQKGGDRGSSIFAAPFYYKAEYFHPTEGTLQSGYLLPNFPIDRFPFTQVALEAGDFAFHRGHNETRGESSQWALLGLDALQFVHLTNVQLVAVFGGIHRLEVLSNDYFHMNRMLQQSFPDLALPGEGAAAKKESRDNDSPFKLTASEDVLLLNVEHSDGAWRLTLRVVSEFLFPPATDSPTAADPPAPGSRSPVDELAQLSAAEFYEFYFGSSKAEGDGPANRVLQMKEYSVELDNRGLRSVDGREIFANVVKNEFLYELVPLALNPDETAHAAKWTRFFAEQLLPSVAVGDFVWLWASGQGRGGERIEELLVKCIYHLAPHSFLFEVYPTNRLDQMRQSILQKTSQPLALRPQPNSSAPATSLSGNWAGRELTIHSMIHLPKAHVIQFLLNYLLVKEKKLNGLSTCFFYHAAVSIPQALLYAGEFLCVLIGSKPIVLMQYTTPSEHQWKFPLVQELSQQLVAMHAAWRDSEGFPFRWAVFKYFNDETLVVYHRDAATRVHALLPVNQTQALHPAPYEPPAGASERQREYFHREQIYNAAWNGLMLGYPSFFVLRYCEEFHNPLDVSLKQEEYQKAHRDYQNFLKQSRFFKSKKHFKKLDNAEMQFGFHHPIDKKLLLHFIEQVNLRL